jgi:poly(3-hydroxybutyrate) depolymerase
MSRTFRIQVESILLLFSAAALALAARGGEGPGPNTMRTTRAPTSASQSLKALDEALRAGPLESIFEHSFARAPLSREEAAAVHARLWEAYAARHREEAARILSEGVITQGELRMPLWFKVYGEKPADGRSLYISMHGGGGAPEAVNTQQWHNQKGLYQPAEGVYVAPRAPTDTWDLWHQAHIDPMFDQLIRAMVLTQEVNPDRVYILGYSAGGDGVFQLAPRMADRLAAAAMMAGHPNETKPDGLRNLPFALHMGERDAAYNRNGVAREWKQLLAELAAKDPGAYPHTVELHTGKGHWMDRQDAAALPWMAQYRRKLRPDRIVWLQDDVTHERFYWLATARPKERARVVVRREGSTIHIEEAEDPAALRIRLDDAMLDLDRPVTVRMGDRTLFQGPAPRTIATLLRTLLEYGDPHAMFSAEIVLRDAPDAPGGPVSLPLEY